MRNDRAVRAAALASLVLGGLGFSGGCGGPAPVTGTQIAQDPKELQNREKMIEDMYKKNPPAGAPTK